MGRVDGKVALVTGLARGQGRSHAMRLAEEGADIIGLDLCEQIASVPYPLATPDDLDQTIKEVEATGRRIIARKGDVRERRDLQGLLDDGLAAFGHLDVVVANAGVCPLEGDTPGRGFVDATDVDLLGVMNTVALALPHLKSGASVIVTGSTAAMMPGLESLGVGGPAGYAWAKRTIASYTERLALQLAPHMIRMNAIHPTNCDTVLLQNDLIYRAFCPGVENPTREQAEERFKDMQAMPIPYVEPSDVSALVLFLASDESRYLTGTNIRLDAGAILKTPPLGT